LRRAALWRRRNTFAWTISPIMRRRSSSKSHTKIAMAYFLKIAVDIFKDQNYKYIDKTEKFHPAEKQSQLRITIGKEKAKCWRRLGRRICSRGRQSSNR
jgi:ribosomal protein S16